MTQINPRPTSHNFAKLIRDTSVYAKLRIRIQHRPQKTRKVRSTKRFWAGPTTLAPPRILSPPAREKMPRATRARTRGALQEKKGADVNVQQASPAPVVAFASPNPHPKAVGRNVAASASVPSEWQSEAASADGGAAAEARERAFEQALADLDAECALRRVHDPPQSPSGGSPRARMDARILENPSPRLSLNRMSPPLYPRRSVRAAQWRSGARCCSRRRTTSRRSCGRSLECSSSRFPRRCAGHNCAPAVPCAPPPQTTNFFVDSLLPPTRRLASDSRATAEAI